MTSIILAITKPNLIIVLLYTEQKKSHVFDPSLTASSTERANLTCAAVIYDMIIV